LLLKTKFAFNNGKLNFSSKSKFSLGTKSGVDHEYTLKHKCSRLSAEFKHTASGETSLETENKCFSREDVEVGAYTKVTLDQGENRRNLNANVQLRVHHKNNALLALGVDRWNPLVGAPSLLTAYGSYGHTVDGTRLTFNSYLNFDLATKFAPLVRFFVKGNKGDFTGLVVANVNRRLVENSEDRDHPKVCNDVDLAFRFHNVVDSKTRVGGTLTHDLNSKTTNAVLAGSHHMDKVRLNGKISTDRSCTVGITSTFDDLTLNFVAASTLGGAVEKSGETETARFWVNYRFGLSAEFNRL